VSTARYLAPVVDRSIGTLEGIRGYLELDEPMLRLEPRNPAGGPSWQSAGRTQRRYPAILGRQRVRLSGRTMLQLETGNRLGEPRGRAFRYRELSSHLIGRRRAAMSNRDLPPGYSAPGYPQPRTTPAVHRLERYRLGLVPARGSGASSTSTMSGAPCRDCGPGGTAMPAPAIATMGNLAMPAGQAPPTPALIETARDVVDRFVGAVGQLLPSAPPSTSPTSFYPTGR
jgi:hypothetical protein